MRRRPRGDATASVGHVPAEEEASVAAEDVRKRQRREENVERLRRRQKRLCRIQVLDRFVKFRQREPEEESFSEEKVISTYGSS